jgi:CheY-like chemotaxis protein
LGPFRWLSGCGPGFLGGLRDAEDRDEATPRRRAGLSRYRPGPATGRIGDVRAGVLIVDDHASFRRFARWRLVAEGFDVVGEAADGASALGAASALRPDVVLLDVQLPDVDGFRVALELTAHEPPPAVVLVSSRARSDYGSLVDASRAVGFLTKADLNGAALARVLNPPPCAG